VVNLRNDSDDNNLPDKPLHSRGFSGAGRAIDQGSIFPCLKIYITLRSHNGL